MPLNDDVLEPLIQNTYAKLLLNFLNKCFRVLDVVAVLQFLGDIRDRSHLVLQLNQRL